MLKTEKDIINIIKYLPVSLVLITSIIITFFLYTENQDRFNIEVKELENKYISINKDLIKYQIEKIKDNILYEKKLSEERLKTSLKNQVNNAYNIAMSIYKHNQDKSKEEITLLIKDALRDIRFNEDRGYYFIYEVLGKNILHPIKPQLEGSDMWEYKDKKGTYLIQEMNNILLDQKSTYYSWYWNKPNNKNDEFEKIGYFRLFEPFDWFIGSGEYVDEFVEHVKKDFISSISNIRYKADSYVFLVDFSGTYLSYYNEKMLGKNVLEEESTEDVKIKLKRMQELVKQGGGYISYIHKDKPNTDSDVSKISYIDGIEDWQWILGTGFYLDDFYLDLEKKKESLTRANKQALYKLLVASTVFTLIILVVFLYISSLLEEKFIQYRVEIKKQIDDNIKKDNMLSTQSKMTAMGEMLSNVAYQWKQPLSTVSTILTGIKTQKELGLKDDRYESENLEKINKQILQLSQTIDNFREFFKTDKTPIEFNIKETVEKTLELVELQLSKKDIIVVSDVDSMNLLSLENELIQVLINIFNNASEELIKINTKRYIFINCKKNEEKIIISIKDNAGGIDLNNIDNIFEANFSTKNTINNSGIGLFMCEEIVLRHLEGDIQAKNSVYKYNENMYRGAEFRIILPVKMNLN